MAEDYPAGYRRLWAGYYRLADGAGPYAWDGAAGFTLKGSGLGITPVGGAALLVGETNGFATDFLWGTDAERVAVKVANATTNYALDAFYANAGTSPKQVFDVSGNLVWSPHNMYIQSATPATRTVTTVIGQNYTVTVTGTGSLTGSAGASGVATAASPLTYTATTTSSTFTLAGSLTTVQMNRGPVATAYIPTVATARNGLAIDYDPVTHAAKGVLCEPASTNMLLNSVTLSTQSVTVTAAAHVLSFYGTGTITLSGVSTAGPLVGTGVNDRVSLTFTPTAGSLTLTVTGTVTRAQLETGAALGNVATSFIPTYGATATRAVDGYNVTPASINYSATAGSWWADIYNNVFIAGTRPIVGYQVVASVNPMSIFAATAFQLYGGTATLTKTVGSTVGAHKLASAFQSADRALTADGLTVAADALETANLLSPGTTLYFGNTVSASAPIFGYIRKLRYVPRRKTNPELVTETTP